MRPFVPTTARTEPDQPTPSRICPELDCCVAQVCPSFEVRIVPFVPTATKRVPSTQLTLQRSCVVPECWTVQVVPSGEVRMVPPVPTAVRREPDQVTLQRNCDVPECRAVQVTPSGEVRIVPLLPTVREPGISPGYRSKLLLCAGDMGMPCRAGRLAWDRWGSLIVCAGYSRRGCSIKDIL